MCTSNASAALLPRRQTTNKASKKLLWALSGPSSSHTIIDDSTLLTSADLERPDSCGPSEGPVRKRRACKNCSCGLAESEAEETPALSSGSSSAADSGAEEDVTFTLPKKAEKKPTERERLIALAESIERGELVTSCGNCAMGDAFRCPSCPYLGLPAFTPGQKVEIDFGDDL
ncbi:hypothetical protein DACRYDRAFT_21455 [Dacryopinax primogenitus]|uniref:Anamorsin C-terminal domain-containing protein n=1 Tax=Dacryopinax primogenitus (strain DJM 731) TaxID=1858805 RepID=M5GB25_DACPD|nr:uncharacterized protein DACRYDRAFT_21455 [Dacryopinax primogenitus]EJU03187.1 hypothetical protein DACRYDRAFT_21455 [Dacryopinax primogenitus]